MKNYLLRYSTFVAAILCWSFSLAQNLVPNPSFEDTTACPDWENQIERATGWMNFGNTPDYFNSCADPAFWPESDFSVPNNFTGHQFARTGNGYAGVLIYESGFGYHEFIGIQLSTPLEIGTKYYVSINASLAYDGSGTLVHCASDHLGVKFSSITYTEGSPVPSDNLSHMDSAIILDDTAGWSHISGSYVADAAYEYLMIGSFFDDVSMNVISIDTNPFCGSVYYYIDDVCVSTDSMECINQLNTPRNEELSTNIYPNPVNNALHFETEEFGCTILILNSTGKIIVEHKATYSKKGSLNLESLSPGIYYIQVSGIDKNSITKFIKNP